MNQIISIILEDVPEGTGDFQNIQKLTDYVTAHLRSHSQENQKLTEMEKEVERLKAENEKLKTENLVLKEYQKETRDEIIDTMKCIIEKTRKQLGLKNEENHKLMEEIEECKKCMIVFNESRGNHVIEIDEEFNELFEDAETGYCDNNDILDPYTSLTLRENSDPGSFDSHSSMQYNFDIDVKDPYRRLDFSEGSDQESLITHLSDEREKSNKATMTEMQLGHHHHENEKGDLTEDILERDDTPPQKIIPLLKHLLEESKHDYQCLKEENEELQYKLQNSQEMKEIDDNLKKENSELKKEMKILRNQLADIESITELIVQERISAVKMEQEIDGMQKDLHKKSSSIFEKEREEELKVISAQLTDEISKTQSLQSKYNEMQAELEKSKLLEPQIVCLTEQLTTEISKTENLQTEYNKMVQQLDEMKEIETENNKLIVELDGFKTIEADYKKLIVELDVLKKIEPEYNKLIVEVDRLKKIEVEYNEQVAVNKSLQDDLKNAAEDRKKILEELQLKCKEVKGENY